MPFCRSHAARYYRDLLRFVVKRQRDRRHAAARYARIKGVRVVHRIAAVILVMLLVASAQAHAQDVVPHEVDSVPATATVQWTAPVPVTPAERVDGYRVLLDNVLVATTNSLSATSATFRIDTLGRHTITVKSFNTVGETQKPLETLVDVVQKVTLTFPPGATQMVVVIKAGAPLTTATVAAPFTDPAGHKWALTGSDVICDGARVGGPASQLVLASGKVYAFVATTWFLNAGGCSINWSSAGTVTPKH